jgi:hypothetical protein
MDRNGDASIIFIAQFMPIMSALQAKSETSMLWQVVEKQYFGQTVQKCPDARRAKI